MGLKPAYRPQTGVFAKIMHVFPSQKKATNNENVLDLLFIPSSQDELVTLRLLSKARNSILLTGR